MIGFEMLKKKDNLYVLDSISEPSLENFENIINRQLHLISDILKDPLAEEVSEHVNRVRRYDNFLKRCISKELYTPGTKLFLWQFLSGLKLISKLCLSFQEQVKRDGLKINKASLYLIKHNQKMFSIIKEAYLRKKLDFLTSLYDLEHELSSDYVKKSISKNPLVVHHLLLIAKQIGFVNSPLTGLLEMSLLEE